MRFTLLWYSAWLLGWYFVPNLANLRSNRKTYIPWRACREKGSRTCIWEVSATAKGLLADIVTGVLRISALSYRARELYQGLIFIRVELYHRLGGIISYYLDSGWQNTKERPAMVFSRPRAMSDGSNISGLRYVQGRGTAVHRHWKAKSKEKPEVVVSWRQGL